MASAEGDNVGAETAPSSSPAVLRRWIALELKRLRKAAGYRQRDAAERIGRTHQQVANQEAAKSLLPQSDLEVLLDHYGVPDRIEFMIKLLTAAKKGKDWWAHLSEVVPDWFDLFLGLESGAAELGSFDALLVRGLLQTPAYAEAVIRADTDLTDEDVHQHVELRVQRQRILDRADEPVRLWTVLDESVLYRQRGGPEVMREQLAHLVAMSERPRIDIQVLPLNAGAHKAEQCGTFTVMKFPHEMNDPGLVYYEALDSGIYLQEPHDVERYERALQRVRALAATPDESRGIIERAMKEV